MKPSPYALLRITAGVQLVKILDRTIDSKNRWRVQVWSASSRRWSNPTRRPHASIFDPTCAPGTPGVLAAVKKFETLKRQAGVR